MRNPCESEIRLIQINALGEREEIVFNCVLAKNHIGDFHMCIVYGSKGEKVHIRWRNE